MSRLLLQTKLYAPALRSKLVPRPRLVARLQEGVEMGRKATLVAAPAGFGKTTLVSAWLARLTIDDGELAIDGESPNLKPNIVNRQFCWLSLDSDDNDLSRFLSYVIAAVQTVESDFAQGLLSDLATSVQSSDAREMIRPFLNELSALPFPLLLVLDDYHVISDPHIHTAVAAIIDYLPPRCHVVITSRDEPPLPLPRWRVRNQLTHVTAADLRFRGEEAATFLRQTMGLALSETAVATLEARTEGWIAGLQLAALSLRHASRPEAQIHAFSGSDRLVADYLLAEVLDQQPPAVQSFLLHTSLLTRFSAPLCDLILEQEDSRETLDRLEQMNLFLVPLDNRRGWYRYHHLFAQLLQDRLRRQVGETAVADLHRRAARWFAAQDLPEEAVQHALQARDFDAAAELVTAMPTHSLWQQGGGGLFRQWGEKLPPAALRRYPRAAYLIAAAHFIVGDIGRTQAVMDLVAAEEGARGWRLLLQAIMNRNNGRYHEALSQIEAAQTLLVDADETIHVIAEMQLANIYHATGRLDQAEAVTNRVSQRLSAPLSPPNLAAWLQVQNMRGLLAFLRGELLRAEQVYREGLEQVRRLGGDKNPMVGMMHSGLGDLFYEWNEMEKAAGWYEQAMTFAQRTNISDLFIGAHLGLAHVATVQGDAEQVHALLQEVRTYINRSRLEALIAAVATITASFQWQMGEVETAVRWANACGLHLDDQLAYEKHAQYRLLAAIRLSECRLRNDPHLLPQIGALAQRLAAMARTAGNAIGAIEALTVQSLVLDLQGEQMAAQAVLADALSLARPGTFVRIFLKYGEPLQRLLAQAAADSIYTRHLLDAFTTELGTAPPAILPPPVQLTPREQDVLKGLVDGLSNKAISARLVVSNNTVRTHLKNLYSKLDVSSRTAAIKRARELGLI